MYEWIFGKNFREIDFQIDISTYIVEIADIFSHTFEKIISWKQVLLHKEIASESIWRNIFPVRET